MDSTKELAEITRERILNGDFYEDASALPECPSSRILHELFDILFFASLRTEEGQPIRVRVYYSDPAKPDPSPPPRIRANRWKMFGLGQIIPLTTSSLVKFAKAADSWSTGIAIFYTSESGLFIWGLVDQVIHLSTSLVRESEGTYLQPGLFHAVINGPGDITVLKETTLLARLAQDRMISDQNDCLLNGPVSELIDSYLQPICDEVLSALIAETGGPVEDSDSWRDGLKSTWVRTLSRIILQIQRQRHGGALLLVDSTAGDSLRMRHELDYPRLSDGIKDELFYSVLRHNAREDFFRHLQPKKKTMPPLAPLEMLVNENECEDIEKMIAGAVRFVSSLAGIDGLVLMGTDLSLRAFGTIISVEDDISSVLLVSRDGEKPVSVSLEKFGTRHGSMVRFCNRHPGALGIVVSNDGDIRVITRLPEGCVLFDNVKVHDLTTHSSTISLQAQAETYQEPHRRRRLATRP